MSPDARSLALDALRRVFTQGAFASAVLRSAFSAAPGLAPADRGLATELVYGVLRRRGQLDRALGRAADKRLKDLDPKLHDVLRLGAYQLIFLDRVPAHAAVDAAVEQAKRRGGPRAAGQANAILRKLAALPPAERLPAPTPLARDAVRHVVEAGGLPQPLAELLVRDLGPAPAAAFALASLEPAPLTLRANLLRTTRAALRDEVGGQDGAGPLAVRLPSGAGVLPAELPAVVEGRATPQDEASMRVVELLDPAPGEAILDVCAAPGGKTTYIAERLQDRGRVVAHDRLPDRLAMVGRSAARLGLGIVELAEVLPFEDERFDRVLVDAPCSGLGTLRRHPEIRWRFSPGDLESLTRTQREVLEEGARRVRPGGVLVYSVCTVTRAEAEAHLGALEAEFEVETLLRTSPADEGAPDGFFAARMRRRG